MTVKAKIELNSPQQQSAFCVRIEIHNSYLTYCIFKRKTVTRPPRKGTNMVETITAIKIENYLFDNLENEVEVETTEEFFEKYGEIFIKQGTENLIFFCTMCGEKFYAIDLFTNHIKSDHIKQQITNDLYDDAQEIEDIKQQRINDLYDDAQEIEDIKQQRTNDLYDGAQEIEDIKQQITNDLYDDAQEIEDIKPISKTLNDPLSNEVQDDVILSDSTNCAQFCENNGWNEDNSNNTTVLDVLLDDDILNSKDREPINSKDKHSYNEVQDNVSLSDTTYCEQYCQQDNWNEDNYSSDITTIIDEHLDEDILNSKDREPIDSKDNHLYNEVQDNVSLSDTTYCDQYYEEDNWNEDSNNCSDNTTNFGELAHENKFNSKDRQQSKEHLKKEVQDEATSDSTNCTQVCKKDNKNSSYFGDPPFEDMLNTKFTCAHCKNDFECFKDLKRHDCGLTNINKNVHQCEICQKIFPRKPSLELHKITHEGLRPHSCEICGASFSHKTNLIVHVRRHTNERPFKCDFCEKTFVSSTEKKVHTRYHTGERKFVCEICGMGHMSSSHLNVHRSRHLGIRNYKCTECNKSFYDAISLKMHRTTHPDAPRSFKCDKCKACFKNKQSLKQHSKIHDKVKNYSCKICSKTFAQHPGLYSHMKSHAVANNK